MLSSIKRIAFRKFKESETRFHELNYLFWECTMRCNLNCLHCGSDCSMNSSLPDMPMNDFLAALDTIKKPAPDFIVVFTGGEPLLRNDIELCGREIRKRGMRWSLVTNGLLYNKERQNSLLNAGLGALTISLDGLEESHNWLRNSGNSFRKAENAIELAAASPRLNFDVVTCVNSRNFNELPEIQNFLTSKGVKSWRLFTIVPIGRAKCNPELFLSDQQFTELMDLISNERKKDLIDLKFSCEGFVGNYESKVRDTPFFCRAGINIGSVLADGSISACPNIDRSFVQGNIYKDDLYDIWQNKFSQFRERSWTKTGKCADCKEYRDCQGNGFHNWHGDKKGVLVCHNEKIKMKFEITK
jgi:radical SAM enzyme (rSAM/lipoprotein system)